MVKLNLQCLMANERDSKDLTSTYSSENTVLSRSLKDTFLEMLSKFEGIQKQHKHLEVKNQNLESDNTQLTNELNGFQSLTEKLNKLMVEKVQLNEECKARQLRENKFRMLTGSYASNSKSMETLLVIQKLARDKTGIGFESSNPLTPSANMPVFVKKSISI